LKTYGSTKRVNGCPVIFQYLPAICYAILLVESIYSDWAVPAAGSDFISEKGLEEKGIKQKTPLRGGVF